MQGQWTQSDYIIKSPLWLLLRLDSRQQRWEMLQEAAEMAQRRRDDGGLDQPGGGRYSGMKCSDWTWIGGRVKQNGAKIFYLSKRLSCPFLR